MHNNKFQFFIKLKNKKYIILKKTIKIITLKKSIDAPCINVPYCTSVCDAKSSGELIGATILSTVKKAAKLAVYDDIKIRVKNHHTEPTILPDIERGDRSLPCCMKAPRANQNEFKILNSLTMVGGVVCWLDNCSCDSPPVFIKKIK